MKRSRRVRRLRAKRAVSVARREAPWPLGAPGWACPPPAALATVTVPGERVTALFAASRATTLSTCEPSGTFVVSAVIVESGRSRRHADQSSALQSYFVSATTIEPSMTVMLARPESTSPASNASVCCPAFAPPPSSVPPLTVSVGLTDSSRKRRFFCRPKTPTFAQLQLVDASVLQKTFQRSPRTPAGNARSREGSIAAEGSRGNAGVSSR